jgi:hypothetical protein
MLHLLLLLLLLFAVLGFELRAFSLSHSTSPFFCDGCLQDRVSWTVCPGWLWTMILLISASWVARITDMSHKHPALLLLLYRKLEPILLFPKSQPLQHSLLEEPLTGTYLRRTGSTIPRLPFWSTEVIGTDNLPPSYQPPSQWDIETNGVI